MRQGSLQRFFWNWPLIKGSDKAALADSRLKESILCIPIWWDSVGPLSTRETKKLFSAPLTKHIHNGPAAQLLHWATLHISVPHSSSCTLAPITQTPPLIYPNRFKTIETQCDSEWAWLMELARSLCLHCLSQRKRRMKGPFNTRCSSAFFQAAPGHF